jgi:aminoglycoside phosphotransferase (APT) family kinase protein
MTEQLLHVGALATWLDDQGLERGLAITATPLAAGASNVMMAVDRGAGRWVLRRPARVAVARANDGMAREYRLLAALAGSAVPHPGVVALCTDHAVLGCTFYLMERIEGVHPFPAPAIFDDDEGRAGIACAMVEGLAQLHCVDWRSAGLDSIGHPEHFHERQVERWSSQLASYEGRALQGMDVITPWLEEQRPADFAPTLMHGDYHMLNALIAPDAPARLVAILDWETATLGDPLLDLAGFCEVWCSVASAGWPTQDQLIDRYCAVRGVDRPDDLTYYQVLYHFRLAVLLEGIYQRSLRDPSRADRHDIGERALMSTARAVELTGGRVR